MFGRAGLFLKFTLTWLFAQQIDAYMYLKQFTEFNIKPYFHLFESKMKPIMCNGSQIWGNTHLDTDSTQHVCYCIYIYIKNTTYTLYMYCFRKCGRLPLCVT